MEPKYKDTMIDSYLAAVRDLLPAAQRKDTVTEIHSLIQDALDDRSKKEGRDPDEYMVASVLKEFGSPEKFVAPYLPERYLIGPRMYPIFILVLRIALPIIAILSLVGFWVGTSIAPGITGSALITNLVKSLGNALSLVVQAFGNIVVIFAILQWAIPGFKPNEKEWDPHQLKPVSQPDKIKRGELITEVVFTTIGVIIFNFYLDKIGIYNMVNGQWSFTPILTQAFTAYLPWLDLFWLLTILLDVILLRKSAWDLGTRLFAIGMSLFNIALAVSFMTHIQYLYTLKGAMGQAGGLGILQSLMNQLLIVVFLVVIITSAVKVVSMTYRMARRSSTAVI